MCWSNVEGKISSFSLNTVNDELGFWWISWITELRTFLIMNYTLKRLIIVYYFCWIYKTKFYLVDCLKLDEKFRFEKLEWSRKAKGLFIEDVLKKMSLFHRKNSSKNKSLGLIPKTLYILRFSYGTSYSSVHKFTLNWYFWWFWRTGQWKLMEVFSKKVLSNSNWKILLIEKKN